MKYNKIKIMIEIKEDDNENKISFSITPNEKYNQQGTWSSIEQKKYIIFLVHYKNILQNRIQRK
jgi:hypothetical protein